MGAPKDLQVHHFLDPIGNFGGHWRPFWIFEVLIEGMIESKSYFAKVYSLRSDLFPDPVGHFGLRGGEVLQSVQRCRR